MQHSMPCDGRCSHNLVQVGRVVVGRGRHWSRDLNSCRAGQLQPKLEVLSEEDGGVEGATMHETGE